MMKSAPGSPKGFQLMLSLNVMVGGERGPKVWLLMWLRWGTGECVV